MSLVLDYTDFDRSIWESELDDFVPENVFDAHAHCWDDSYAGSNDNPASALRYPGGYNELKAHADEIFPKRRSFSFASSTIRIRKSPAPISGLSLTNGARHSKS